MDTDNETIFDSSENNNISCSKQTRMKEEVNVNKLIETFSDMANRETLLTGNGVTQQDLLMQIIGTVVVVAMEKAK